MIDYHVLDIYGAHLHVATTQKDWNRLCRAYPAISPADVETNRGFTAVFSQDDRVHVAFFVRETLSPGDKVTYCAHEATHGAILLLENLEAKFDGMSEPLAYLIGWLTRWLWETVC